MATKKKVAKKQKPKTKRGRAQDKKLVAGTQLHEVKTAARRNNVSQKKVKKAVKRVGNSKRKVDAELNDASLGKAE